MTNKLPEDTLNTLELEEELEYLEPWYVKQARREHKIIKLSNELVRRLKEKK